MEASSRCRSVAGKIGFCCEDVEKVWLGTGRAVGGGRHSASYWRRWTDGEAKAAEFFDAASLNLHVSRIRRTSDRFVADCLHSRYGRRQETAMAPGVVCSLGKQKAISGRPEAKRVIDSLIRNHNHESGVRHLASSLFSVYC